MIEIPSAILWGLMHIDPVAVRNRFLMQYDMSPFRSMAQLSRASDYSEGHLTKIANGYFDNSKTGPGTFGFARVAWGLGTTPDVLLGFKPLVPVAVDGGPSIAKMFQCYIQSGGRLEGFAEILNFCDVYAEPKDGLTRLLSIGPLGLLARRKPKSMNVEQLQHEFQNAPSEVRQKSYAGQRRCWERGALAEPDFMDWNLISRPLHVRFPFVRVGCRVSNNRAQERLLIYCETLQ